MYKVINMLIAISLLSACAYLPGYSSEPVRKQRVIDKAAWDLHCDKNKLSLTKISDTAYGIEGCGKRASYAMVNCNSGILQGYTANMCVAFLDSSAAVALTKPKSVKEPISTKTRKPKRKYWKPEVKQHHTPASSSINAANTEGGAQIPSQSKATMF